MQTQLIFSRKPQNFKKFQVLKNNLENVLSEQNVEKWNLEKTQALINCEYEEEFIVYRFNVLKNWIIKNEEYSDKFVKGLDYIIRVLDLEKFLKALEINYIQHYKDVVFSKKRNIKSLIVDFDLRKKEEVWYRYEIKSFLQKINKNYIKLAANKSELYLSNQRIIVTTSILYTSIDYDEIEVFKLNSLFLQIKTKDHEFVILTNDVYVIYTSFERVAKLVKKNI